jgi:hypothetical protein
MPRERLIQAAGSSKRETGFRIRGKSRNFPTSFKQMTAIWTPRRKEKRGERIMNNPETRLQKRERELSEKISAQSLKKGSSGSMYPLITLHIQRGYQSSGLISFLTTMGAKKTPEKKRAAASRKRVPSMSLQIVPYNERISISKSFIPERTIQQEILSIAFDSIGFYPILLPNLSGVSRVLMTIFS